MEEYNIGKLISSALEFKGISQKEAAKMMNIPYSTFNNYVRNKREPDFRTLLTIFRFLEIDMNRSFSITPSQEYTLSASEAKMIRLYRNYSNLEQGKLLRFVENFIALLDE